MNAIGMYIPMLEKVTEQMNQGKIPVPKQLSFEQILNNKELNTGDFDNLNADRFMTIELPVSREDYHSKEFKVNLEELWTVLNSISITNEPLSSSLNSQAIIGKENEEQQIDFRLENINKVNPEMVNELIQSTNKIEKQHQIINDQLTMLMDEMMEKPEIVDQVLIEDVIQVINKIKEQTQDTNSLFTALTDKITGKPVEVDPELLNDVIPVINKIEEQTADINAQHTMLMDKLSEKPEIVDRELLKDVLQLINDIEGQTQNSNDQQMAFLDRGLPKDKSFLTEDSPLFMLTENSSLPINLVNNNEQNQVTNGTNNEKIAGNKNILNDIILNFNSLITQIKNTDELSKISPKVLELLKNYFKLDKAGEHLISILQQSNTNSKEQLIWQDLIHSFSKRENLSLKQQYNVYSEVTSKDVTKWLVKSFEKHVPIEPVLTNPIHTGTSLSKIEQYVIHLNNNQETSTVNQQLIRQFESIIKTSRFFASPNGTNQLSITLNPENLGELRIKLMQINGEMTVKIVVSTQIAREMLESNMNQLRNMFLPHQVMIEKQELHTHGNMMPRESNPNQQWDGEGEQQTSQSNEEKNHTSEDETELSFNELLMNLKV